MVHFARPLTPSTLTPPTLKNCTGLVSCLSDRPFKRWVARGQRDNDKFVLGRNTTASAHKCSNTAPLGRRGRSGCLGGYTLVNVGVLLVTAQPSQVDVFLWRCGPAKTETGQTLTPSPRTANSLTPDVSEPAPHWDSAGLH